MRVRIVEKGEGRITADFAAETATEATILAVCSMGDAKTDLTLSVTHPTYPANAPPVERVVVSGFSIPVHEILQNKK